jgi:hypothetical protein
LTSLRPGDFNLDGEECLVAVIFVHNRYPFVALQRVPLNLVSGRAPLVIGFSEMEISYGRPSLLEVEEVDIIFSLAW